MKKFLLSFIAIVLCLPAFILAGCKEKPHYIDMDTYFNSEVKYSVYNSNEQKSTLSDFTHNNHDNLNKYTSITFEGKNDWLYLMTIETISFEIYSNIEEEVEFTVRMTNLKNGNQASNGQTSVYQSTVSPVLKKNQATKVSFTINDIVKSVSTTTKIEIIVDASYFTGDNASLDFKFDIMNLQVAGQHK